MQRITIDPITRLEGRKIEIFLNEEGDVANTYFQIPELRGFERFRIIWQPPRQPMLSIKSKFRRPVKSYVSCFIPVSISPITPPTSTRWAARIS